MTVLHKQKPKYLTLNASEDIILSDFLASKGVFKGDVVITVPANEFIGGTVLGGYALNVGNILSYGDIAINVYGEIQGGGGNNLGDLSGLGGIYSVYPITINIMPTGAVRGGGGGGKKGDDGPNVTTSSWSNEEYNHDSIYFRNPTRVRPDEAVINGVQYLGVGIIDELGIYKKGTLRLTGPTTWGGQDLWYAVRTKIYTTVPGGDGGLGGLGEGYNQERTLGEIGEGNGDDGGDGGLWGEVGGNSGGNPGFAIYGYEGAATGIIVNNLGIIQGREYY